MFQRQEGQRRPAKQRRNHKCHRIIENPTFDGCRELLTLNLLDSIESTIHYRNKQGIWNSTMITALTSHHQVEAHRKLTYFFDNSHRFWHPSTNADRVEIAAAAAAARPPGEPPFLVSYHTRYHRTMRVLAFLSLLFVGASAFGRFTL